MEATDILTGLLWVLAGLLGGMGWSFWWGERGRRKDLMWYTQLHERPKDLNAAAETAPRGVEDSEVLRRVEIAAVKDGLREQAKTDGVDVSDEELEQEALRLTTQYWGESG